MTGRTSVGYAGWLWCRRAVGHTVRSLHRAIGRWRHRRRATAVVVQTTDPARRRALERELHVGLARLRHAFGARSVRAYDAIVLAQQALASDRPLAGCCQIIRWGDGDHLVILRLALQVGEHRLETDTILGVLAEQYVGLVTQSTGATSVLVPVELPSAWPPAAAHRSTLQPDPLAPQRPTSSHQGRAA
jgi:hypothetical protein